MIGAFIVGAIISLFNNYTQGINLPPLAIAFLAGYAVEVFFAFLDTLVRAFQKGDAVPQRGGNETRSLIDRALADSSG